MPDRELAPAELAFQVQHYFGQVGRTEQYIVELDTEIAQLTERRARAAKNLGNLARSYKSYLASWATITEGLHADPLYPFVMSASDQSGSHDPLNDYKIVREGIVDNIRGGIVSFHAFTDSITEPAPVLVAVKEAGYVGYVLPDTRISVQEDKELVVPLDRGIRFATDEKRHRDITPVTKARISSRDIVNQGFEETVVYGDEAVSCWQEWLSHRGKKHRFEQWLAFREQGADSVTWLAPEPELVDFWKLFLSNSILSVIRGRIGGAQSKIEMANKALGLEELQFTTEERMVLEGLITEARFKLAGHATI